MATDHRLYLLVISCAFVFNYVHVQSADVDKVEVKDAPKKKVVFCYYETHQHIYRKAERFLVEKYTDTKHCTHIVFGYHQIYDEAKEIRPFDPMEPGNYQIFTQTNNLFLLRRKYPDMKFIMSIGGWTGQYSMFSDLVTNKTLQKNFLNSLETFLGKYYKYEGIDIKWEYPTRYGGTSNDRLLPDLLKIIKDKFKSRMLIATVTGNVGLLKRAYNLPEIAKHVDLVNVMTYDYAGAWDKKVVPISITEEVEKSVEYVVENGVPAEKVVLGIPLYGRTYILKKKLDNHFESPFNKECEEVGFNGSMTSMINFMANEEICYLRKSNDSGWFGHRKSSFLPYITNTTHVVVYEDQMTAILKVNVVEKWNLAGVMVLSINNDDFLGNCNDYIIGVYEDHQYPMLQTINNLLYKQLNCTMSKKTVKL